jgi:2,3-diketo-5-methylthio-1-phosphopentane phosphatase
VVSIKLVTGFFGKMRKIFVSDYDGTITEKDFYSLLAERYVPADTPDYFAQYREGRITHFEAMAAYFAFAPTEEQQLEELFEASHVDPDLGASAALLQRAGWQLLVVSAGSSWYVERVLRRAGVAATVYSNPGRLEHGRGLVLEKPGTASPYHSASVGVDKSAVVRQALYAAETVAFAGDGPSDFQPALLVRPELRFARGLLADELRQCGEAFRPFSRWSQIAKELV